MNEKAKKRTEGFMVGMLFFVMLLVFALTLSVLYLQESKIDEFKEKYEQQKEENNNIKDANSACRDYMLEEKLLIELQEENYVGNDNMLPVFHPVEEIILNSQTRFGNLNDAVIAAHPLVYCPDETKIKFHFKLTPPLLSGNAMEGELEPVKDWSFICSFDGEDVKVEKDEANPDYYYIVLDEKGLYKFDQKFVNDFGEECHIYFFIQW